MTYFKEKNHPSEGPFFKLFNPKPEKDRNATK
jgi:hypothetical protein